MRYTLRNIPPEVDAALRRKAAEEGRSVNDVAVEALERGLDRQRQRHRDLGDVAGTWQRDDDVDRALADQRRLDRNAPR